MRLLSAAATALCVASFSVHAQAEDAAISDPENTLVIEVGLGYPTDDRDAAPAETGTVTIELLPDNAPAHVERIKTLANACFYDGVVFHRVIEGFMAQTGDPTGTGRGGSELNDLPAEFSDLPFERGVVGAARSQSPNSANSQFFIMFDRAEGLDWNYTVWGRVTGGMEIVDRIKRGPQTANGVVEGARDRMITARIANNADISCP